MNHTAPQARQVEVKVVEFNADFIARMMAKLDWGVLRNAAQSVRCGTHLQHVPECLVYSAVCVCVCLSVCLSVLITLPQLGHGDGLLESPPEDYESNEDFLRAVHHVMMEVGVLL